MRIAASIRERANQIRTKVINKLTDADERAAEEEARAKAEAEEAERLAAEQERIEKEAKEAEAARLVRQEQRLTEIRDLLKKQ